MCANPALTRIFIDKVIEEKCQNLFKSFEPRTIDLKNGYEDMSNLLSGKVECVKLSKHV